MLKRIRKLIDCLLDEVEFCRDNELDVAENSLEVLKDFENFMSKDLKARWKTVEKEADVSNEKN